MVVNTDVLRSSLDRWFPMNRTIRIEASPDLIALGNRIMNFLEKHDQSQAIIDALSMALGSATDELHSSTVELSVSIPKEKQ